MHGVKKRIVYILRSDSDPARHYVGITNDVHARLDWHNHGSCGHTTNHRPWSLVVSMEFCSEKEAVRFEKYLKSGSGRAFAKRHVAHASWKLCDDQGLERKPTRCRWPVHAGRSAFRHGSKRGARHRSRVEVVRKRRPAGAVVSRGGCVLVTGNDRDFQRIRPHVSFEFEKPWPGGALP